MLIGLLLICMFCGKLVKLFVTIIAKVLSVLIESRFDNVHSLNF